MDDTYLGYEVIKQYKLKFSITSQLLTPNVRFKENMYRVDKSLVLKIFTDKKISATPKPHTVCIRDLDLTF
jgi:hypothetical protein